MQTLRLEERRFELSVAAVDAAVELTPLRACHHLQYGPNEIPPPKGEKIA